MKTRRTFSFLCLALATGLFLTVAGRAEELKFEKKIPTKIGYSVYDMQQPYWQAYAKGIEDAAKAAGYGFVLSDQKSSQQTEVSGSIDLINQGVSALIVSPVQPPALPAVIEGPIRRASQSSLATLE